MNRRALLPVAFLLDRIAGDPEWLPHPVRLMGLTISRGETILRRRGQTEAEELVAGALLTATVVAGAYSLTRLIVRHAYRSSVVLGWIAEIGLGWTCLAARNLQQEGLAVTNALESGDIALARQRLARIVGRDTQQLDVPGISRAVIETMAESASDGIIAPLVYMSLGGVPMAMAYKAVNTLDSMIGHADARYCYFGRTAARLDDVANYIPARLTALAIIVAANIDAETNAPSAWKTWLHDGNKHKSPNAGQPESAMAGALHIRLGGGNFYDGEFIPAEPIGEDFAAPKPEDAAGSIRIVSAVALLGLGASVLLGALLRSRRSR